MSQAAADFIPFESSTTTPVDVALKRAGKELGSPIQLTGGSGHGWSSYTKLQKCPYMFYRSYVNPLPKSEFVMSAKTAMDIGSVYHAFHAFLGQRLIDLSIDAKRPHAKPSQLKDLLLSYGASAEVIEKAWLLFSRHVAYYDQIGDYIQEILAVERHVKDRNGPDTARYDQIVRVGANDQLFPGVWIRELKSASRTEPEPWQLDGEVLGQIRLWKRGGLDRIYGELQGVIVDVAVKTKVPNYYRVAVAVSSIDLARYTRDLRQWKALAELYRATGTWPRALANCWHRYGPCRFWEHCKQSS